MAHLAQISDQEERIKQEIRDEQRRMQEAQSQEAQSYREQAHLQVPTMMLPSKSTAAQPSMGPQVPKIHQLSRISEIQQQVDIQTKSPKSTKNNQHPNGQLQNAQGWMLAQVSRTNRQSKPQMML